MAQGISLRAKGRRWPLVLAGVAFALGGGMLTARWLMHRKAVTALAAMAERYGYEVRYDKLEVGFLTAAVRGLAARPLAGPSAGAAPVVVDRIDVELAPWRLGSQPVRSIRLAGFELTMERLGDGTLNLAVPKRSQPANANRSGAARPPIHIVSGRLRIRDAITGAGMRADELRGAIVDRRVEVVAGRLVFDLPMPGVLTAQAVRITRDEAGQLAATLEGGAFAPWPELALTGIRGTVSPRDDGGYLLEASGSYAGAEGQLWSAQGQFHPRTGIGAFDLVADHLSLASVAPRLQDSSLVRVDRTMVDAKLHAEGDLRSIAVTGHLEVADLTIAHPKIAEKAIERLHFGADVTARLDVTARHVTLTRADLRMGDAKGYVTGWLNAGNAHAEPPTPRAFELRVVVPPAPCAQIHAAIPPALAPHLARYKLAGTFSADVQLAADWSNLAAAKLRGSVGLAGCKVVAAPRDIERMVGEFKQQVEVERDVWKTIVVGPANDQFVSLEAIAPFLQEAILMNEDPSFYRHRGFLPYEFEPAFIRNLQAGRFKYGASTITMQFVKNTLLSRDKTIARKLQELFLAWRVEQVLEKARIYEIYLNIIEFGPGIYGVGPAAQHYFNKSAAELNPNEATFLASLVSSPKLRYKQFCTRELASWTLTKMATLLDKMKARGKLSESDWILAKAMPLEFAPTDEAACLERRARAIRNNRPTDQPDAFEATDEP